MTIGIKNVQVYLPEKRLKNEELITQFGFDGDFLKNKLGIQERHIAGDDELCSDLAVKAAEMIFETDDLYRKDIGLLVLCTQNPDYRLPHTSAIIQDRLGLGTEVAAFDINLGCSGFVYSLSIAKAFMETHRIKHGIILTSDPYSKITFPGDRDTIPIFGDAATATLLSGNGRFKIMEFSFGTDGSGYSELIVKNGNNLNTSKQQQIESKDNRASYLYMNGRAIFDFMMTRVPASVLECLKLNKLEIEEIDYFIFHQAGKYMLDNLGKALGIEKEKIVFAMENTGNTVSSSIPIALIPFLRKRKQKNIFLISGFGVGLSWASTVLIT